MTKLKVEFISSVKLLTIQIHRQLNFTIEVTKFYDVLTKQYLLQTPNNIKTQHIQNIRFIQKLSTYKASNSYKNSAHRKRPIHIINNQMFLKYFRFCLNQLETVLDLDKINNHQSLAFISKNYNKKPSDILTLLIALIAIAILLVQGLKVFIIVMCYVLPACIMILKICESMKQESSPGNLLNKCLQKEPSEQNKTKKNQIFQSFDSDLREDKPNTNSKSNTESELTQEQSKLLQVNSKLSLNEADLLQNSGDSIQELNMVKNNSSLEQSKVVLSQNQICKLFILYFMANLILDLVEPLVLPTIQYAYNVLCAFLAGLSLLVFQGDFWGLVFMPFQFIVQFILTIFATNQIGHSSYITWIAVRIFIAAILLQPKANTINIFSKIFQNQTINQAINQNAHLKNE